VKAVDAGMLLVVNVRLVLMTGRAEAASLRPFSSPTLETTALNRWPSTSTAPATTAASDTEMRSVDTNHIRPSRMMANRTDASIAGPLIHHALRAPLRRGERQ
jgi:hypothetical protein